MRGWSCGRITSRTALRPLLTALFTLTLLATAAPGTAVEAPELEQVAEYAEPGSEFEPGYGQGDDNSEAQGLSGFSPHEHGAATMRGDTWSDPRTGPDAQTRDGVSWPKPGADEDPEFYDWGCHVHETDTTIIGCVYNGSGTTEVALVGSSYIAQWWPAIKEVADREDWRVRLYTKTWCDFQPGRNITTPKRYPECDTYNTTLLATMKSDTPDIVITSHYDPTMAPHMTEVYRDLINRGVDDVVGLWNSNGAAADEGPGWSKAAWCIRDVQNGEKTQYNNHTVDYRECHYGMGDVGTQGNTAMQQVDANLSGFHYIPLQDWMCPADSTVAPRCPGVVGQVMPWRDGAHLTNEWTHSMSDPVHEALYRDGVANSRPNMHKSTRIAGNDRYATSAAVSADASQGQTVYVSTGADFPDTLAAGAKAGHVDSAVLLTRSKNLPEQILHRLVALQPSRVVVTGSSGVVSDGVISQIRTATGADATRIGGANRYETAANLATQPGYETGGTVYVTIGEDFPDALTASARAGREKAMVLLTKGHEVPAATSTALSTLQPTTVVVVGGANSIDEATAKELGSYASNGFTRVAGVDRYDTAARLAAASPSGDTVYVAVGDNFADAGSVAPVAANHGTLLLTRKDIIPSATVKALVEAKPSQIVVVGGTSAISETVRSDLAQYIH